MKKNRNGLNDLARFYYKNLNKNLIRINYLQTILKVACEYREKQGQALSCQQKETARRRRFAAVKKRKGTTASAAAPDWEKAGR